MRTTTAIIALFVVGCVVAAAAVSYSGPPSYELFDYDPVANPKAVVTSGNARFTVLTENVIRMEYSSKGRFEDRPTLAVLHRNLSVPKFSSNNAGGILTITTESIKLSYKAGGPFSSENLIVEPVDSSSAFKGWNFGMRNDGNLLGTIKSLDLLGVQTLNCTENAGQRVHDESLHCEWGLVSRDGWAILNDTENWALSKGAEWWDTPVGDDHDLYIFTHGHDYRGALSDYVQIGGKIAMVPRYITGTWWTRWYDLNNIDVKKLVNEYRSRALPLDVFVLDMDWHTKYHWGGYTPDPHLFPFPNDTFDWMHDQGLAIAANLHDDDGVHNTEVTFVAMCKAMGLDPNSIEQIPFSAINKTYVYSLEDIVLASVPFDFWWIDWQQGGTQGGCAGEKQNPTIWTDKIRVTDPKRQGRSDRGVVLARWGGMGNHRYQVGFSGDVSALTWDNLAYQPYFSMTGTNVGYGFWSHDIEGPSNNHEMYVRWVQWASYSAVFRSHDRGMSAGDCANTFPSACSTVRVWEVPNEYFECNRAALQNRAELIPYIYTAYRQAFDTGLSIIRPMYYDFPEQDMAYKADENGNFAQYMFGDDILAAPVLAAADHNTQMAKKTIWIPPGQWFEKETGQMLDGGSNGVIITKSFDMTEIPVYIKAGAVIPGIPFVLGDSVGVAKRQYTTLTITIYPGAKSGFTTVYEDDGMTTEYTTGAYAWTNISYVRTDSSVTVNVVSNGKYDAFPSSRKYIVRLVNNNPLTSASVNNVEIKGSRFGGESSFSYDGAYLAAVMETDAMPTASAATFTLKYTSFDSALFNGARGMINHGTLAKRNVDMDRSTPGAHTPVGGHLMSLSSTGDALEYLATHSAKQFADTLKEIPSLLEAAVKDFNASQPDPAPLPDGALVQYWDQLSSDSILCGSSVCPTENPTAKKMRIEGYLPETGTPGTIGLYLYWNGVQTAEKDNYVTTNATVPSGYQEADFGLDGQVFASEQPGTIALQLFYKESINDHLTVASDDGLTWAQSNGYKLINDSLGYIYKEDPSGSYKTRSLRDANRIAYSVALLDSARVSH